MKQILHITSHMGGGVGKVLSGLASFAARENLRYRHVILLLELPEKLNFVETARQTNAEMIIAAGRERIVKEIERADIVSLEWWHHPKMAAFLAEFPQVRTRLMIWAHISGCYYPYISPAFLTIPEEFVFTSRYSLENPYWSYAGRKYALHHCSIVNSSGGFAEIEPKGKASKGFCIGYLGTQSFSKLHPDFMRFCAAVAHLPGMHFIMVGDRINQEKILCEAKKYGLEKSFSFLGYMEAVGAAFQRFDVFGYLLNPQHFGTTENALLEAMTAELPVIALRQCTEQHLIEDHVTGMLVENEKSYRKAVEFLYHHPMERKRLGQNARRYVLHEFSVESTVSRLHLIYQRIEHAERRRYQFTQIFGHTPWEWFLACLPPELKILLSYNILDKSLKKAEFIAHHLPIILREENKSSIQQFHRFFPQDNKLKAWAELILNAKIK